MNKIAEIRHGKVAYIYETSRTIEEMRTLFVPATLLVDVTNTECAVGWKVDFENSLDNPNFIAPKVILPPTIIEMKSLKLQEVNDWTASKITGGFTSSASGELVTYDSDKDTQLTMQGIALNVNTSLFAEKYPTGCPVRGYAEGENNKSIFMLNAEQVLRWCADLSMHIGTCKQLGWIKQAEVDACTTKEELDAIVLN